MSSRVPKIMVFKPTWEQFKDFPKFVAYMESMGAHHAGIAKVIPPSEYKASGRGYDKVKCMIIPKPMKQLVTGKHGLFTQTITEESPMNVADFQFMATSTDFEGKCYATPPNLDFDDLERKFWESYGSGEQSIYGMDVTGSVMDSDLKEWNIDRLGSILDEYEMIHEGMNTAYLYFGMWKAAFCWHVEDMDLYSINYIHFGGPKTWYGIPPAYGHGFERLAARLFPKDRKKCAAFLRHKMTMISPKLLDQGNIPFDKIVQEEGEFMITFPFGYHCGFNHSFNCAESTNFAIPRWIDYGKAAVLCGCGQEGPLTINMDSFIKNYQPERYEVWKSGKERGLHPEATDRKKAKGQEKIGGSTMNLANKSIGPITRLRSSNCKTSSTVETVENLQVLPEFYQTEVDRLNSEVSSLQNELRISRHEEHHLETLAFNMQTEFDAMKAKLITTEAAYEQDQIDILMLNARIDQEAVAGTIERLLSEVQQIEFGETERSLTIRNQQVTEQLLLLEHRTGAMQDDFLLNSMELQNQLDVARKELQTIKDAGGDKNCQAGNVELVGFQHDGPLEINQPCSDVPVEGPCHEESSSRWFGLNRKRSFCFKRSRRIKQKTENCSCTVCGQAFSRFFNRDRHMASVHLIKPTIFVET